jgi:hypothetical protein
MKEVRSKKWLSPSPFFMLVKNFLRWKKIAPTPTFELLPTGLN